MESKVPVSGTGSLIVGGVNKRTVGYDVIWKRVQRSVYSSQPTTAILAFSAMKITILKLINAINDALDPIYRYPAVCEQPIRDGQTLYSEHSLKAITTLYIIIYTTRGR